MRSEPSESSPEQRPALERRLVLDPQRNPNGRQQARPRLDADERLIGLEQGDVHRCDVRVAVETTGDQPID